MISIPSAPLRRLACLLALAPLLLAPLACQANNKTSPTTAASAQQAPQSPAAKETAVVMRRVFDWQIANLWSTKEPLEHRWGMRGWVQGAFLTGVMEAYRATHDTAYTDYATKVAEGNSWKLGSRPDHADDHIVGQTYLELNELSPSPSRIANTRAGIDRVIAKKLEGRKLWHWCDSLYMAPPTFAKLAKATGEKSYLNELDRLFWDANAYLYDPVEKLYYRDDRFFNGGSLVQPDGKKVFWSRGNGWVIAGLARLLDDIPADHPTRARYETLFKDMAGRIVELQPADGLWRTNMLHPESGRHGEASGSAFFCYAFAWGINKGLLPADKFRPAVDRTWKALLACVDANGLLGWVQPVGFGPEANYDATKWQEYGAGAFLSAGSQVMKLP